MNHINNTNPYAVLNEYYNIDALSIQVINDHIKNLKNIKAKINSICIYIVSLFDDNLFV